MKIIVGPPDPPSQFEVLSGSITASRIAFTWISGFDGGATQTFNIEYTTSKCDWLMKTSIESRGSTEAGHRFNSTIDDLSAQSVYLFRIYSENRYGRSNFSADRLNVKTLPEGNYFLRLIYVDKELCRYYDQKGHECFKNTITACHTLITYCQMLFFFSYYSALRDIYGKPFYYLLSEIDILYILSDILYRI